MPCATYQSALQVVKLSDAVQTLPRQTTQFIHGVPQQFLAVGDKKSAPAAEGEERFSRGAYFMGKAVWAKGYTELLSLLESHRTAGNAEHHIDCYGNGEDLEAVSLCSNKSCGKLSCSITNLDQGPLLFLAECKARYNYWSYDLVT